jgi:hypothetical protein
MDLEQIGRIERLASEIEAAPPGRLRTAALELLQSVLKLHGDGLARVLEISGEHLIDALTGDDLISSLLLLHGLHPETLERRVSRAIARLNNSPKFLGAQIRFTGVSEEGTIRLKLKRGKRRLKALVEDAVLSVAPDAASVIVETDDEAGFVPLSSLLTLDRE